MPDVITIGNALIDSFLTLHDENVHARVNAGDNELCIRLGEKILLDSTQFVMGGNACNVAVGMSRIGIQSGLIAEIGDDAFGQKIMQGLQAEDVDTAFVTQRGESSFAVGLQFQGDRTLFVQHHVREHAFPLDTLQAKLVFLTSLGTKWHHVYEGIIAAKKGASFLLAVNPGTPQLSEGRAYLAPLFAVSDMVFLNKEETQGLLGTTEEDPIRLLSLLHALGGKLVVMMDGEHGAYAQDHEKRYFLPAYRCEVVEKTGAGDSWTTGFMAAQLFGKDVPTSMKWGNANAVSVIGKIGAQAGLLPQDMLETNAGKQPEVEVVGI